MKIRELYIESYKMFRDFKIDFVDSEEKPLDIVVLAGVNGSGKSAILDLIYNFDLYKYHEAPKANLIYEDDRGHIINRKSKVIRTSEIFPDHNSNEEKKSKHIYFKAGVDDINQIADEFVKTFYYFLKEKDYRPSEVKTHFDKYMQNIFDGLEIGFQYSHLDKEDNVWFINQNNEEFQMKELSTGEKTLLSKVLYLYFKDYKDKVILIDEPELSLHPSWQNRVLKIYKNFAKLNNCQIIIATHSPHIIGSAKSESIRLLSKEGDKIEVVDNFSHTYGAKFSQILTDVMGVDYLRVPIVAQKLDKVKAMIAQNSFESDEFNQNWQELEEMLGKSNLELKLLKLEIASRKKNVSNS